MKRLVLLENDTGERAKEDFGAMLSRLEEVIDVEAFDIEKIENFGSKDLDDTIDLMFDPSTILVTRSMFTTTYQNSLGQLGAYISIIAREHLDHEITYIDLADKNLLEALDKLVESPRRPGMVRAIYNVVSAHNLVVFDYDSNSLKRIVVDFKGFYKSSFGLEDFNIKEM